MGDFYGPERPALDRHAGSCRCGRGEMRQGRDPPPCHMEPGPFCGVVQRRAGMKDRMGPIEQIWRNKRSEGVGTRSCWRIGKRRFGPRTTTRPARLAKGRGCDLRRRRPSSLRHGAAGGPLPCPKSRTCALGRVGIFGRSSIARLGFGSESSVCPAAPATKARSACGSSGAGRFGIRIGTSSGQRQSAGMAPRRQRPGPGQELRRPVRSDSARTMPPGLPKARGRALPPAHAVFHGGAFGS